MGSRRKPTKSSALFFGVGFVDRFGSAADPLAVVLDGLKARPEAAVLLHGYLTHERAREQIDLLTRRLGMPTALLLLECAPHVHARKIVDAAAEKGQRVAREVADWAAYDWANRQLPALEAAAREARLPVLRVSADGDFNEQMTSFLVAASSV